jgi:hypothetical protein
MRLWASPGIRLVRARPINLYVEWPGYPATYAQGRLHIELGRRDVSGYPATQIPRGSGSPQPQPIGQTHLPSHPIIIMCGMGVLLGLVGEVFWISLLSPTLTMSFASPPRRRPSSGESPKAALTPGSSYLLGMVVALSYLSLAKIFTHYI